ncbi:MAG: hypothetical protein NC930_01390 [Candidatus Omnitrophica bacterium]|nr:hypothetical protein [Candidatus Omnitrophota bacterium]
MNALAKMGPALAVIGMTLCPVAVVVRLLGNYHFLGVRTVSLLVIGIALMVMACTLKLYEKKQ